MCVHGIDIKIPDSFTLVALRCGHQNILWLCQGNAHCEMASRLILSSLVNCQMLVTAFVFIKENPHCRNGWLVEWLRSLAALVLLSNIESGVLLDSTYTPHICT